MSEINSKGGLNVVYVKNSFGISVWVRPYSAGGTEVTSRSGTSVRDGAIHHADPLPNALSPERNIFLGLQRLAVLDVTQLTQLRQRGSPE